MPNNLESSIEHFKKHLESLNWKEVQPDSLIGESFELTAYKKIGLVSEKLMVKHFPKLDEEILSAWIKHFKDMSAKPKKILGAHTFALCIMADTITEGALNVISSFPFEITNKLSDSAGKGNVIIVDFGANKIYSRQQGLAAAMKKMYKEILTCIDKTYNIAEVQKSPKPETTYDKMKLELRNWGFGLIGLGVLQIVLSSILDPIWGVLLIGVGISNIFYAHRAMFLLNGVVIMLAAILNAVALHKGAGAVGMFIIMQFVWGIFEIRKYKLYDEVKQPGDDKTSPVLDNSTSSGLLPESVKCPGCGEEIELDFDERRSGKYKCPACGKSVDLSISGETASSGITKLFLYISTSLQVDDDVYNSIVTHSINKIKGEPKYLKIIDKLDRETGLVLGRGVTNSNEEFTAAFSSWLEKYKLSMDKAKMVKGSKIIINGGDLTIPSTGKKGTWSMIGCFY